MRDTVFQIVTDRILAALEAGTVPWKKTWKGDADAPANFISRKPYRGINAFILAVAGFESNYWLTYRQAAGLGGNVKRGENGFPVVFWKFLDGKELDAKGNPKRIPLLRYYTVFNLAQTEGIAIPARAAGVAFNPIEAAEAIVAGMPQKPEIRHGQGRAFYRPSEDFVGMPSRESFSAPEAYYSTLFHELAHSTGHVSRLNREGISKLEMFGSDSYGREELIAEMSAAFVGNSIGLESTFENSAAYLAGWIKTLREDNRAVVVAAGAASKAAKWILNDAPAPADPEADADESE